MLRAYDIVNFEVGNLLWYNPFDNIFLYTFHPSEFWCIIWYMSLDVKIITKLIVYPKAPKQCTIGINSKKIYVGYKWILGYCSLNHTKINLQKQVLVFIQKKVVHFSILKIIQYTNTFNVIISMTFGPIGKKTSISSLTQNFVAIICEKFEKMLCVPKHTCNNARTRCEEEIHVIRFASTCEKGTWFVLDLKNVILPLNLQHNPYWKLKEILIVDQKIQVASINWPQ